MKSRPRKSQRHLYHATDTMPLDTMLDSLLREVTRLTGLLGSVSPVAFNRYGGKVRRYFTYIQELCTGIMVISGLWNASKPNKQRKVLRHTEGMCRTTTA